LTILVKLSSKRLTEKGLCKIMQLAGELNNFSLPNLIRLISSGNLTGKMTLVQEAKQALIYFDKGRIVHAEKENEQGRETLMELFCWDEGTFAFSDGELTDVLPSLDLMLEENTIDNLLSEGVEYADQQSAINRLNVGPESIFKNKQVTEPGQSLEEHVKKIVSFLDGRTTLAEASKKARLTRRESVDAVHKLITCGLIEISNPEEAHAVESIKLPEWVKARLRQDNPNLAKSIVDMVIWVDRVKCWMYQADADLGEVVNDMASYQASMNASQSDDEN